VEAEEDSTAFIIDDGRIGFDMPGDWVCEFVHFDEEGVWRCWAGSLESDDDLVMSDFDVATEGREPQEVADQTIAHAAEFERWAWRLNKAK
jgi:hypothetical protein